MIYLELLWSFMQVGLFSIGGGYAALPLIQEQVVQIHPWLSMTQFADILAIAEMTPGPITINTATFVGIQLAGIPGAITATVGSILPSCVIVLLLATVYYRYRGLSFIQGILSGLRPAVVAMIASAGLGLVALSFWGSETLPTDIGSIDGMAIFIFACALFVLRKWKPQPVFVMLGAGGMALVLTFLQGILPVG